MGACKILWFMALLTLCCPTPVQRPKRYQTKECCDVSIKCMDYGGDKSVTKSGLTCQRWDSDEHHERSEWVKQMFKEGKLGLGKHNHCRNPSGYSNGGHSTWCYTTDAKKRWEECEIQDCAKDFAKRCKDEDRNWCSDAGQQVCQYSLTYSQFCCKTCNDRYGNGKPKPLPGLNIFQIWLRVFLRMDKGFWMDKGFGKKKTVYGFAKISKREDPKRQDTVYDIPPMRRIVPPSG